MYFVIHLDKSYVMFLFVTGFEILHDDSRALLPKEISVGRLKGNFEIKPYPSYLYNPRYRQSWQSLDAQHINYKLRLGDIQV